MLEPPDPPQAPDPPPSVPAPGDGPSSPPPVEPALPPDEPALPPEEPALPPEEPSRSGPGRGVALMLTVAALLAAAIATRASLLTSSAGGEWASSIREEVKLGAAMLEDVRYVYNVEAIQGFRISIARVRAEEYRRRAREASGEVRALLLIEARAQEMVAESLIPNSFISQDPKYETEDGGYDLGLRLTDIRAENPEFVAIDPDAIQAEGDDRADAGVKLITATVPVGVAFLFGALAQAHPRRRRGLLLAGWVTLGLSTVLAVVLEVTR